MLAQPLISISRQSNNEMNKKKILLVDDDADDQFIFLDAMSEIDSGIECLTAETCTEALTMLKAIVPPPSLIFLDLNMPFMNGFACLDEIKKDADLKQIPVIIFTTSSDLSDKKRAKELGAEIFFTKTANFKLLKEKLLDIFNSDFSKSKN